MSDPYRGLFANSARIAQQYLDAVAEWKPGDGFDYLYDPARELEKDGGKVPWSPVRLNQIVQSEWSMRCDDAMQRFILDPTLEVSSKLFLEFAGVPTEDDPIALQRAESYIRWPSIRLAIESGRLNSAPAIRWQQENVQRGIERAEFYASSRLRDATAAVGAAAELGARPAAPFGPPLRVRLPARYQRPYAGTAAPTPVAAELPKVVSINRPRAYFDE